MKKAFTLRAVLTVTTGRLLTERKGPNDNGIGDLYDILNHMTRDNLFTHQLGRAAGECKLWLLRWFPELAVFADGATLDKWIAADKTGTGQEAIKMWLAEMKVMFPEIRDEYEIEPIPQGDHDVKDPYDELVQMRGTAEGVVIIEIGD